MRWRSKRPLLPDSDVVNEHLGGEKRVPIREGNPAANCEVNDHVHRLVRNQSSFAERLDGVPVEVPRNDIRLPIDAIGVEFR